MRRYLNISKGFIMDSMSYRFHFIFSSISNVIYMILIFFLWKSIYSNTNSTSLNGMTFNQTFLYLTLASTMFNLFKTWADWSMSRQMMSGTIITFFLRPLDYQAYVLFESLGDVISNLTIIFLPSLLLIIFVFGASIPLGINILFFTFSLVLAYLISFCFDFCIGLTSFYTESIWGISITKEVVIMLLSGALIPLPFFPEPLKNIVQYLPFQAIYNIPLSILTNNTLYISDYIGMLGSQAVWVLILVFLNRLYFNQASKIITVNGG